MTIADALALFLSATAVFVALRANWKSERTAKEQTVLQRRMVELETTRERDRRAEARKARLTAHIERWPNSDALVISNDGPGEARVIEIRLGGVPLSESDEVAQGDDRIDVLGPGGTMQYGMLLTNDSPSQFPIEIRWEDASEHPGVWESVLR